ncbi:MAG: hypothetical protein ACRBBN_00595 [Methyloligellaceae bacterium]
MTGFVSSFLNISSVAAKIFISFLLGTVLLVFSAVTLPGFVRFIRGYGSEVEQFLRNDIGTPDKYGVWVDFIIDDQQFVFLFFVLLARILMSLIGIMFRRTFFPRKS